MAETFFESFKTLIYCLGKPQNILGINLLTHWISPAFLFFRFSIFPSVLDFCQKLFIQLFFSCSIRQNQQESFIICKTQIKTFLVSMTWIWVMSQLAASFGNRKMFDYYSWVEAVMQPTIRVRKFNQQLCKKKILLRIHK